MMIRVRVKSFTFYSSYFTLPVFVEMLDACSAICWACLAASSVTSEKVIERKLSLHRESTNMTLKAVIQQRLDDE